MPAYRSKTSTAGRNMAGARALWRATGMKDDDFQKPIIAVVNSFTQFVPGHVHLKDIAMGHDGMLYSLPSRDIIADSVEYMVNAHCADAMVCISNCDKITPGMLMAAMRINIPVVFVSGGPMEAGKVKLATPGTHSLTFKKLDLIDAMVMAADDTASDADVAEVERSACPTCGSCSGMFTANSMNCLTEALGLSLPGNGTTLATHSDREQLFKRAGRLVVDLCKRYYEQDDSSILPRSMGFKAFENAMTLDIAMGGSTNTILHILAIAQEAGIDFTMQDIDRLSRVVPQLCKVAPNTDKYHIEDVHRAGGTMAEHAFSQEGGLAVLVGNIALKGCVVKTAGVDDSLMVFEGPAHVTESQDEAVTNILDDKVKAGDIVIVRYEGPKGGPGMQEMLYPTSYIKSKGLGKACALLTDGRFSGGTSGLSIGHASPEAAAGGAIGLVRNGDRIRIDIPNRSINVLVSDEELAQRRAEQDAKGWKPAQPRPRKVSAALKAYAKLVMSADKGAVRDLSLLDD